MTACPNAQWGLWTNGKHKAVFRKVQVGAPRMEEPMTSPQRIDPGFLTNKRDELKHAADDNMLFSFRICHDHIYVTDGMHSPR